MRIIAAAFAALFVIAGGVAVQAAPLSVSPSIIVSEQPSATAEAQDRSVLDLGIGSGIGTGLVQKVHGCHPDVQFDRFNGQHYHGPGCGVIRTGPPPGAYRGGGDYYGEPRRRPPPYREGYGYGYGPRPPICRQACKYTGPFKSCKTICQ